MFLPNKIIRNKNLNYPQKNVGLAHGFKTMCNPWFDCTWFRRALQMVLRPCVRPPKQPIVLGGLSAIPKKRFAPREIDPSPM